MAYEIPFAVPDISKAAANLIGVNQRNRENARADDYLELAALDRANTAERESHARKRQKVEDERKHAIEAWTAMPTLKRAALNSMHAGGDASEVNINPYGIKFNVNSQPPDQGKADADVASFLDAPPQRPVAPAVPRQLLPTEEGPEQTPEAEAARFASTDDLMGDATGGAPIDTLAQAAANSFGMPTRKLSATYQGRQFDVIDQPDTTGLGPKYDAIYQRFLQEPGVTPEEALKAVTKMAHEDSVESGRNQRLIDAEAGRDKRFEGYHMNVDQQFDALNKRLAMQEKTARINAGARVATAGTASVPAEVLAAMSKYATDHPGDQAGLYELAKAAKIADPAKAVGAVVTQGKSTEGQKDDALNSRKGLRAAEAMKMSGYVPTREDTQKWLNNQRWVYASKKDGLTGLFVLAGQTARLLPQSEVEGLSPEGQEYFANVRRLMEPLGRAASGAAISEGEWVNFFNQYGPNSRGGLDAAIRDLNDMYKLSGSAGRSLGEVPGGGAAPRWIPIPASLAGNPKLKGKSEIQVDAQGNVLGAR